MIKILVRFLKPYWLQVLFLVIFQVIQTLGTLFLPDLNAQIINEGVVKGDQAYVWTYGGIMLGVAIAQSIFQILAVIFGTQVALKVGRDVRAALFNKVQNISEYEVGVFGTPSLITRETNDITQIQTTVMFLFTIIVSSPMMLIGGILFVLKEDVQLSMVFVGIIPILLIVIGVFLWVALPLFKKWQKLIDKVNLILREQISGVRPIKAFVREKTERDRFQETNDDLTKVNYRVGRMMAFLLPFVFMLVNLSTAVILAFGGNLIDQGKMQIGALTAFITYAMFILMSLMMAMMIFVMMPRASVSARRISMVLNIETTVKDTQNPLPTPIAISALEYKDVKFYYKGARDPVIQGINFQAEPGDTVAIVGATGSGKSTIVKMLPRLFDASEGEILINGTNSKDFALDDLRALIGFVPQTAFLFEGTVRDNLRFGNENAGDEEFLETLKLVSALDFLDGQNPLETWVDQGGENFSGGQRQRLTMARALVRHPAILVLDDSYSALDATTEREIRDNLASQKGVITLVVSQKISSIQSANSIMVLDDGTMVGLGTHDQLIQKCPAYQAIYESQKYLGADFDA